MKVIVGIDPGLNGAIAIIENFKVIDLFEQRDFFLSLHFNDQHFFTIFVVKSENYLEFSINDEKIKFNLPKSFNEIFENVFNKISNIPIVIKDNHYYPFKQLIKKKHSSSFLTDIQNTIMCNLLLNSECKKTYAFLQNN